MLSVQESCSVIVCKQASYQQKRKICVIVCATCSSIHSANFGGPGRSGFTAEESSRQNAWNHFCDK